MLRSCGPLITAIASVSCHLLRHTPKKPSSHNHKIAETFAKAASCRSSKSALQRRCRSAGKRPCPSLATRAWPPPPLSFAQLPLGSADFAAAGQAVLRWPFRYSASSDPASFLRRFSVACVCHRPAVQSVTFHRQPLGWCLRWRHQRILIQASSCGFLVNPFRISLVLPVRI